MADDRIDIEEHDILDNPVIRRMFPDISVLKKEVIEFNDEGLMKEFPAIGVQQDAEKYAVIVNDNNKTLPLSSHKPVDQMIDSKFTESNLTQIDFVEKYPTIVIDETNDILPCLSNEPTDQLLGFKFTETICKQSNEAEKYPTIIIDETDVTLPCFSSKPADKVLDAKFTENLCRQIDEADKYPTEIIHETNIALSCFSSKPVNQALTAKVAENVCRQTIEPKKYPTIVIDETNESIPGLLHEPEDQVLGAKLTESNLKEIVVAEKYPAIVIDKTTLTLPCLSNKSSDQVLVQFPKRNKRHQIYDKKLGSRKKYVNAEKTGSAMIKVETIEQKTGSEFLRNSKNVTCNINEKEANLKLSKSLRRTDKYPIHETKYSLNLDINVPEYSEKGANRNPLTVISIPQSNLHNAGKTTIEQSKWKGNKIILGSKSSAINSQHKACRKQNIIRSAKVLVENLGTFLSKSSRYCKTCLILFPSNKTLTDHRNLIHSQVNNNKFSNCNKVNKKCVKLNKKHKCNICGVVFASSGNLLRHKRCVHILNIKKRKRRPNLNHNIQPQPQSKLNEEKNFKCTHCNRTFSSQQALIDHMYNVLQSKTNKHDIKSSGNVNLEEEKINSKSQVFYRCSFCSSYFKQKHGYVRHVKNMHKTDKINLEKVFFDPLCKYCPNKYCHVNSFNVHVWKYHQKQVKLSRQLPKIKDHKVRKISKHKEQTQLKLLNDRNDIRKDEVNKEEKNGKKYLLKSVFFKCVKCNLCFLSGEQAANHIGHESTITNWKCSKCSHIFRKAEQNAHAQQHLFSDSFEMIEISENTYFYLLFKCPNCTSYFREKDLFYHYSICEMQSPDSAYCKICHILIDNKIKELHDIHHKMAGGKKLNNILVETDIISRNDVTENKLKESINLHKKVEDKEFSYFCHEKVDDKMQKKLNIIHNGLEEKNLINSAVESDIRNEEKYERGTEKKEILANKKANKMIGKLLKFIYCGTCKTFIFVNRERKFYDHTKGRCLNLTNYVCKFCGLVLSNKTIESHRKLHQNVPNLTLSDFIFYDLKSGKKICPPVPKYPNCHLCEKHFITKTAIISHSCSENYLKCHICNVKLSKTAFPLHISFHNYYLPKSKLEISNTFTLADLSVRTKDSQPIFVTKSMKSLDSNRNCEDRYLLVFVCKICKVAVDTYDRVIEHCHYDISSQEKKILTTPCDSCNLIFDDTCFDNHKMLHSCNQNNKFSVLTYDAFYVTAEDTVWLNHLFGSLAQKDIDHILKNSMYNVERKIKMHILQDGLSPDLTLYKCAKCYSFVDPSSLYKHCRMDTLCYKSKIVPCPVCGILLMSEEYLAKHEKIHEIQNITISSYKIVLFNCDDDKNINHILSMPRQYVLYECRNCNGIVDKKRFAYHICDFEGLSKCSHCGLLLYNNDYMSHVNKHKEFCSFHESNIIVILLGAVNDVTILKSRDRPSFRGVKLDYIVYKCAKCQVCLKDKDNNVTHNCVKDLTKTKCLPCNLYFEESFFMIHRKMHECDLYFSKENITVVDLECPPSSDMDIIFIEDEEDLQNNDGNTMIGSKFDNINDVIDNVSPDETVLEKYDEIFKCLCGLHFLTEANALSHYKATKCNNSRRSKQTCPKCGLTFRPNILYSHLLKHHGNKKVSYKFNIILISK